MGLFLIFVLLSITFIIARKFSTSDEKRKDYKECAVVVLLIGVIVCVIIAFCSYDHYISMKKQQVEYKQKIAIIEDYKNNVNLVENKAFTDMAYQGYQQNLKELIKEAKGTAIEYNKMFVGKNELAKNILFKGLIISPDGDMKLIE